MALLAGLTATAENYFRDGTRWTVRYQSCDPRIETYSDKEYWIDGTGEYNGEECLSLFTMWVNEPHTRTYVPLRVEGDKVYYPESRGSSTWCLLYDFGLQEGEQCEVGVAWLSNWDRLYDGKVVRSTVKCAGFETSEATQLPVMLMTTQHEVGDDVHVEEGWWIKGIGNVHGPLDNEDFGWVGGEGVLQRVESNGEVVYQRKETGIAGATATTGRNVTVAGRELTIKGLDGGEQVTVTGADGRAVASFRAPAGDCTLRLPAAGIYIVAMPGTVSKVAIR